MADGNINKNPDKDFHMKGIRRYVGTISQRISNERVDEGGYVWCGC